MEQLIYELNGRKYLLVEIPIIESKKDKTEAKLKKFECIYQGIKEINRGGFFSNAYMIIKVLVPEENVHAFNNAD